MSMSFTLADSGKRDISDVVNNLVRAQEINGSQFINLPLLYPDGSFVTVRIDIARDRIRVSDAGFAYQEAADIDAQRSFTRTARKIADDLDVQVGKRTIYVDASWNEIERAIIDVATASWRISNEIYTRSFDEDDDDLVNSLNDKLFKLFGENNVSVGPEITGASNNKWEMSAMVSLRDHRAIFQTVTNANSIYRASTAFRDIADLDTPTRLVAVVRDINALGPRKSLLAPGRIVSESQPDEIFRKAAA